MPKKITVEKNENSVNQTIDAQAKNFLTESEMKKFLDAARRGRHSVRDFCLMLTAYRHGLQGFRIDWYSSERFGFGHGANFRAPHQRKSFNAPADGR